MLARGARQPAEHDFRRQAADECRLAACAPQTRTPAPKNARCRTKITSKQSPARFARPAVSKPRRFFAILKSSELAKAWKKEKSATLRSSFRMFQQPSPECLQRIKFAPRQ